MSDEKKLPKRRFKQFLNTPSWEQRKLGEILKVNSGKDYKHLEIGDIPVYGTGGYMLSVNEALSEVDAIGIGRKGTIDKPQYLKAPFWTVDTLFYLVPLEEYSCSLLYHLSNLIPWKKFDESTGVPSLSKSTIDGIQVNIPKDKKEQDTISKLFDRINNLITLHQRKLNKLEKLKKAYLEELFPDGNQCKPKRRFKEFKDDWEQRKLTDISKTFIGLVTTMTTNYREAGTLLIRNSDIRDNKFIFSEKPIYLDSEFAKSNESRKLKSGDVVTVHTGDIGTSAVVEEDIEGAIGFATINTRPDINYLDPHFLSTYFNTERHKKYAISVATGDGRSNYNIKDFNKLMLYMPSINEQKAIAEFIKRITDLITLHQRKLQKLKKLKAAYLDELFV